MARTKGEKNRRPYSRRKTNPVPEGEEPLSLEQRLAADLRRMRKDNPAAARRQLIYWREGPEMKQQGGRKERGKYGPRAKTNPT